MGKIRNKIIRIRIQEVADSEDAAFNVDPDPQHWADLLRGKGGGREVWVGRVGEVVRVRVRVVRWCGWGG